MLHIDNTQSECYNSMIMSQVENTLSADWSRPQTQRQELGPMLHNLGFVVYDQVEAMVTAPDFDFPVETDAQLGHFLLKLSHVVTRVQRAVAHDTKGPHHEVIDYMRQNAEMTTDDDRHLWALVTTMPDLVMEEGFVSGVIAPTQFGYYLDRLEQSRAVSDTETAIADTRPVPVDSLTEPVPVDGLALAERIDSPEFRTMLHQLAHAPNGFLGSKSAEVAMFYGSLKPNFVCFQTFAEPGEEEFAFVFDEKGRVVAFSDEFLAFKKRQLNAYNLEQDFPSGGCPVRHAEFKVVGEAATKYLKLAGREDGRPVETGESLIDRGARLVSAALRHAATLAA